MKSTETSHYLAVALQSLEKVLLPELNSAEAKATGEIMRQVLSELLKRERFTPRLLEEHIAEGQVLAQRMTALLAELGSGTTQAADVAQDIGGPASRGYAALAETHTRLIEHIARLAGQLSARRSAVSDPAQLDFLAMLLHKAAAWECAYHNAQREAAAPLPPLAERPADAGAPLSLAVLQDFLRTHHPAGGRCSVTHFAPIPGGFGKQTYRVTLDDGSGAPQSLIVRKADPMPMVSHDAFILHWEYYLLSDVHAAGFPVAKPLFMGHQVPGVDADFYVMSALPGSVPSSFLGAATAVIPESVILNMAELMAQLHRIPLEAFKPYLTRFGQTEILSDTVSSCYARCVAGWKTYIREGDHLPSPFLTYMLDWLETNVPQDTRRPVLVHGDFNVHNILAEEGRITGVLDWECSNFGAPEQDLAYVKPIISKHIAWDKFVAHYRASGGPEINERTLNYYMAFSAMRVSVAFNKGVRSLQVGMSRDIRFAVVELGLTPEFMNLAMASTAGGDTPAT